MKNVCINISVVIDGVEYIPQPHRPRLRWDLGPVSEQSLPGPGVGGLNMITLKDTQQIAIAVNAVDKKGVGTQVDSVTFTTSDENVASIVVDPAAPNKAVVKAGLPGVAQIQVTADADLGEGVTPLSGTLDVTVVAGDAVSLAVETTGAPEEQA